MAVILGSNIVFFLFVLILYSPCVAVQACRAWTKEEGEDSDAEDAPEEWQLAATMAGCTDVNEMLHELGSRVSALEEVCTGQA